MPSAPHRGTGLSPAILVPTTVVAIGMHLAGLIAFGPVVTAMFAVGILVCGLPHGGFDLALLRRAQTGRPGGWSTALLVALYLACAAAMYAIWLIAPLLALVAFLVLAIVHFAEDWLQPGSSLGAVPIAAAIVSAPAILHAQDLGRLFVVLTGDPDAESLAALLSWFAPAAAAAALVAILLLWRRGWNAQAVAAGCGLAAMLVLPPLMGFALFFCLIHSPMQFQGHARELGLPSFRQWRGVVVPISLGGVAVAGAILLLHGGAWQTDGLFAASFMTLSVLTVPHMLVPITVRLFGRPRLVPQARVAGQLGPVRR